jgi:hypothetical protein
MCYLSLHSASHKARLRQEIRKAWDSGCAALWDKVAKGKLIAASVQLAVLGKICVYCKKRDILALVPLLRGCSGKDQTNLHGGIYCGPLFDTAASPSTSICAQRAIFLFTGLDGSHQNINFQPI